MTSNDSNAAAPETTFVFGDRATALPTTGTARYGGEVTICCRAPTQTGIASSEFIANANFAISCISGQSRSTSSQSNNRMPDKNFTFSGTVAGTDSRGSFAHIDSTLNGPISGIFAGLSAQELAGVFSATTAPTGVTFQGGFLSKQEERRAPSERGALGHMKARQGLTGDLAQAVFAKTMLCRLKDFGADNAAGAPSR